LCENCKRSFNGVVALNTHFRFHPSCNAAYHESKTRLLPQLVHRDRRTVDFKCQILEELTELINRGIVFPQKMVRLRVRLFFVLSKIFSSSLSLSFPG
jgi:hypothetical protein